MDQTCVVCGNESLERRHCKETCVVCGYTESCEDLFPVAEPEAANVTA